MDGANLKCQNTSSLHDRRFMSQAGRTRYFARSATRARRTRQLRAKYRVRPAWLIKRLSCRLKYQLRQSFSFSGLHICSILRVNTTIPKGALVVWLVWVSSFAYSDQETRRPHSVFACGNYNTLEIAMIWYKIKLDVRKHYLTVHTEN